MSFFLEDRNRRKIKGVAGGGFKGPDSALAENYGLVPFAHDVLGTHQEFLYRHGHTTLEQYLFSQLAHLFQKCKILGIAGTDLDYVGVRGNQLGSFRVDNLGYKGKTRKVTRLGKQFEALLFQALE